MSGGVGFDPGDDIDDDDPAASGWPPVRVFALGVLTGAVATGTIGLLLTAAVR
jgi:hypothetical protein